LTLQGLCLPWIPFYACASVFIGWSCFGFDILSAIAPGEGTSAFIAKIGHQYSGLFNMNDEYVKYWSNSFFWSMEATAPEDLTAIGSRIVEALNKPASFHAVHCILLQQEFGAVYHG
jgi:hypothetical protein